MTIALGGEMTSNVTSSRSLSRAGSRRPGVVGDARRRQRLLSTLVCANLLVLGVAVASGCGAQSAMVASDRFVAPTVWDMDGVAELFDAIPTDDVLLIDPATGAVLTRAELDAAIQRVDIVYVGENHGVRAHHELQGEIAARWLDAGHPIAIGLEMLPWSAHRASRAFSRGEIDIHTFEDESGWAQSWGLGVEVYAPLLDLVPREDVTLIPLNAYPGLSRTVFRSGLDAVVGWDRLQVPGSLDEVADGYADFITTALRAHGHGEPDALMIERFIHAQLVWDASMAGVLVTAIEAFPVETKFLVAAGSAHVMHGWGIPSRVEQYATRPSLRVVCGAIAADATPASVEALFAQGYADLLCLSRAPTASLSDDTAP